MKKPHIGINESEKIYHRESEKIKGLLNNPIFIKEREEALESDKEKPVERQKEMKDKQDAFCRKYKLRLFPRKLDNTHFIPVIGPHLEIDEKGRLVWVLSEPLTSIEEKHRLLPEVQQFQDAQYGKPEDNRRWQDVRNKELYDLYYGEDGKKRPGMTYRKVAADYLDRHPEIVDKFSDGYADGVNKIKPELLKEDILTEFTKIVIKAIQREKRKSR